MVTTEVVLSESPALVAAAAAAAEIGLTVGWRRHIACMLGTLLTINEVSVSQTTNS